MVSEEEIQGEGLTSEDVINRELIRAEDSPTDVYWPDYFDDHPESRPGENVRIEEDEDGNPVMKWEDGDFRVELRGVEKTTGFPAGDWRAIIHLPERVGAYFFDEHDVKCYYPPMLGDQPEGYVEELRTAEEGYIGEAIVLRLKDAEGMPLTLVETYPDILREEAEESAQYAEELQGKLDAAHANEEWEKKQRPPGWNPGEGLVCPHCKEGATHVSKRGDGGYDCVHCGESVDDYVASRVEDIEE